MSSVDDRTATPRDERKGGGERKRKERVESSEGDGRKGGERKRKERVQSHWADSSDEEDADDYGVHERRVKFMRGRCHDNPRQSCVCGGGCIMIDKFRLKLHFSRHAFEIQKLEEEIEALKNARENRPCFHCHERPCICEELDNNNN